MPCDGWEVVAGHACEDCGAPATHIYGGHYICCQCHVADPDDPEAGLVSHAEAAAWHQVVALRARVAELEEAARWVPVGERLPTDDESDNDGYVLVTIVNSNHERWTERGRYDEAFDCWLVIQPDGFMLYEGAGWYVIAWMAKPQPYGGPEGGEE